MRYRVKYKRRSDRKPQKWTEFEEILPRQDMFDLVKWLEENENHRLISVTPEKE